MRVKSLVRYTDMHLNREIQMGVEFDLPDERAATLISKKFVAPVGYVPIPVPTPTPVFNSTPPEPRSGGRK